MTIASRMSVGATSTVRPPPSETSNMPLRFFLGRLFFVRLELRKRLCLSHVHSLVSCQEGARGVRSRPRTPFHVYELDAALMAADMSFTACCGVFCPFNAA